MAATAHQGTTCGGCACIWAGGRECGWCGWAPRRQCAEGRHAMLKLNPIAYRLHTTHVGYQNDGAGGWLQVSVCNRCKTSVSREVDHGQGLSVSV